MRNRIVDIKLNVRPIYIALTHMYVFEGPCRFGQGDGLQYEFDAMMAQQEYKDFQETIKKEFPLESVNILEPVFIERHEDFKSTEDMFEAMAKDIDDVDLFFISHDIGRGDLVIELAQRTKKPVMIPPEMCCTIANDIAALYDRGLECYAALDWNDVRKTLEVLRTRKAIADMTCLLAPRMSSTMPMSSLSTFIDLEKVTRVLGTKFRYIDAHELLDQTQLNDPTKNHTLPGRKEHNITEEDMVEIRKIADELYDGAELCNMERAMVVESVRAYWTVKKLLDVYDCNAFSIPCPDICATRRLNEEKFTFCLNHSLMNEAGIPSACEYDIGGLLSMAVLMAISRKAPYLGNTNPVNYDENGVAKTGRALFAGDLEPVKNLPNLYHTYHAVPNRKMKGLDQPIGKYNIQPFAYSGFGATIRYDFKQDKGQVITMARFNPNCDKLFVARGTIVSGGGMETPNCSHSVLYQVENERDFFEKQILFGNHVPLIYGDYMEELKLFGKVMGLEVVTA